jgi:hypothetical protein
MTKTTFWLSNIVAEVDFETAMLSNADLGASPAELVFNPESLRDRDWTGHQGCPEMNLDNCFSS